MGTAPFRPLVLSVVLLGAAACQGQKPSDRSRTGGEAGEEMGGHAGSGGGGSAGSPVGDAGRRDAASGGSAGTSGTGGTGGTGDAVDARPAGPRDAESGPTDAASSSDVARRDAAPASDGRPARPVVRSAGCGRVNPPTGARTITTGGRQATFVVNLPSSYNPNTPMPLGFAFHGYGNPACVGECAGFRNLPAVTVFPKSLAAGWEGNPEPLLSNLRFFEDLVALMKREYCIDENRIFVAGTSSGGQFVEHLACRYGDWMWVVSPVAAFVDRGVDVNCKGTPPVLVIHGVTDRAGNYGQSVAELFARRNGCSSSPPAGLAQARNDMLAAYNAGRGEHRCLNWSGCTANPVRFCIFSYITYNNLTHGWPRVGGTLIGEFLSGLP